MESNVVVLGRLAHACENMGKKKKKNIIGLHSLLDCIKSRSALIVIIILNS